MAAAAASAPCFSMCPNAVLLQRGDASRFAAKSVFFAPRPNMVTSRRRPHAVVRASARVDKYSKSDIIVSPSILSANFSKLGEQVKAVEVAGCDWIHVDVMDGRFVPNITIGPLVVGALRPVTDLPLDVHLMIVEPEQRIPDFIKAGADIVSVHCEQSSTIHLHRTVNQCPPSDQSTTGSIPTKTIISGSDDSALTPVVIDTGDYELFFASSFHLISDDVFEADCHATSLSDIQAEHLRSE